MLDTSLILFSLMQWFDELPGEPAFIASLSDLELARQYHDRVQSAGLEPEEPPPADCQLMVLYLIRRNYQSVSIVCHSFLRDQEETQDFTRTLFLLLLDKLRKSRLKSGFRSWLATLIRNHFIDGSRRQQLFQQYESWLKDRQTDAVEAQIDQQLDQQNLRNALKSILSPEELEIYEQRFRLGLKPQEIADNLTQEVKDIYGMIYRIREKIKRNLPDFYVRD